MTRWQHVRRNSVHAVGSTLTGRPRVHPGGRGTRDRAACSPPSVHSMDYLQRRSRLPRYNNCISVLPSAQAGSESPVRHLRMTQSRHRARSLRISISAQFVPMVVVLPDSVPCRALGDDSGYASAGDLLGWLLAGAYSGLCVRVQARLPELFPESALHNESFLIPIRCAEFVLIQGSVPRAVRPQHLAGVSAWRCLSSRSPFIPVLLAFVQMCCSCGLPPVWPPKGMQLPAPPESLGRRVEKGRSVSIFFDAVWVRKNSEVTLSCWIRAG